MLTAQNLQAVLVLRDDLHMDPHEIVDDFASKGVTIFLTDIPTVTDTIEELVMSMFCETIPVTIREIFELVEQELTGFTSLEVTTAVDRLCAKNRILKVKPGVYRKL